MERITPGCLVRLHRARRFYNLLRGDAAPTLAEAAALARACYIRPEWLTFGSGEMRTAEMSATVRTAPP